MDRRGASEVIGALIAVSAMIMVGGLLLYYYGQQAAVAEERLAAAREYVRIVPLEGNGTVYAALLNVGSQPVTIEYIILYNVTGDPEIVSIRNESILLSPGAPGATIPLIPGTPGKYEIVAVSSLGSVFRWDPESTGGDGILDVPGDLEGPPELASNGLPDFLGPVLGWKYANYTIVGVSVHDWPGLQVHGKAWAYASSTDGRAGAYLSVECGGFWEDSDEQSNGLASVSWSGDCIREPVWVHVDAVAEGYGRRLNRWVELELNVTITIQNPSNYSLAVSLPLPAPVAPRVPGSIPWQARNLSIVVVEGGEEGGDHDIVGDRLVVVVPSGGEANITAYAIIDNTRLPYAATGSMNAYAWLRIPGDPILLAWLEPP